MLWDEVLCGNEFMYTSDVRLSYINNIVWLEWKIDYEDFEQRILALCYLQEECSWIILTLSFVHFRVESHDR